MNNVNFAIPEIYGETLSYYELLRKLVDKTNELVENYNTVPEQIAEAVANLDASQLFSAVFNQLIHSIATDNTKSANAVKVYKKHDLLYATFNETVNLYESMIDFSTGTATELIPGTNIREVNISELFIEIRKLIDINKNNIEAVTALANENSTEITAIHNDITSIENKNTEQDNELSTLRTMISTPYNFKGDVDSISALPASGVVNDTYYVQDVKYKVTWTGSAWVQSSLSEADYQTELASTNNKISELKSDLTSETNERANADNALSARIKNKVAQPLDGNNQPTNGTSGQSLRTKGDGTTEWADVGLPTDEQTAEAISAWLDEHPEATTTVQDHSLTHNKLVTGTLGYVTPKMYGAVGDGVTDDTEAFINCFENNNYVLITSGTYLIGKIIISHSITIVSDNNVTLKQKDDILYSTILKFDGVNSNINISGVIFDCENKKTFCCTFSNNDNVNINSCIFKNVGVNGYSLGNSASIDGILAVKVKKMTVKDCVFDTIERDGILGYPVKFLTVKDCKFNNCGRFPSANQQNEQDVDETPESPEKTYYHNNYVYNCGSGGFDVETSNNLPETYASMVGNYIINCGDDPWGYCWALSMGINAYGEILNNYVENFALNSTLTEYDSAIICNFNKYSVIIKGNTIKGCKRHGIFTNNNTNSNIIITDNIVSECGWNGIYLLNSPKSIVKGNNIFNNGFDGIKINLSSNSIISDNIISNNSMAEKYTYSGLRLELSYDININNNQIIGKSHKYCISLDDHEYKRRLNLESNFMKDANTRWFNFASDTTSNGEIRNGLCEFFSTSIWSPQNGTWNAGDKVYYTDFSNKQSIGMVCISGGSPGTWMRFGAITQLT